VSPDPGFPPEPPPLESPEAPESSVRPEVEAGDLGAPLGERATLVQFSSAFCAPCRATRIVLADVARRIPGVSHIEVDAENRLDLTRRLGILRTPTVLVLDAAGREIRRASGAPPGRAAVLAALATAGVSPAQATAAQVSPAQATAAQATPVRATASDDPDSPPANLAGSVT
jgi:thiol-disulfide isomerase/thioredoxin